MRQSRKALTRFATFRTLGRLRRTTLEVRSSARNRQTNPFVIRTTPTGRALLLSKSFALHKAHVGVDTRSKGIIRFLRLSGGTKASLTQRISNRLLRKDSGRLQQTLMRCLTCFLK